MTKKITVVIFMLALAVGVYAMTAKAKQNGAVRPTPTVVITCEVYTGIERGTVNLRTCAGTDCAVLAVLSEGASLDIVEPGAWLQVTTANNLRGYINSNYCKGK